MKIQDIVIELEVEGATRRCILEGAKLILVMFSVLLQFLGVHGSKMTVFPLVRFGFF